MAAGKEKQTQLEQGTDPVEAAEEFDLTAQCYEHDCISVRQFQINRTTGAIKVDNDEDIKVLRSKCVFCKFFRRFDLLRQRPNIRVGREV